MEIKKYKNMSLRIVQDMKKQGQKVPGYASNLAKEKEGEVGLKAEKSEENYDGNSLFDVKSEVPEDLPEKVTLKLSKQEDTITRLNEEINQKNEKFLELLTELDEIKVQVFARDKSIELQQKQIDELLEELRTAKSHENNVKRLTQKNMALSEEIERLRLDLQSTKMQGFAKEDEQVELSMVKLDMNQELLKARQQLQDEKTIRQKEVANLKKELNDMRIKYEPTKWQQNKQERALEEAKQKMLEEAEQRIKEAMDEKEKTLALTHKLKQQQEEELKRNEQRIADEQRRRRDIEEEYQRIYNEKDKEIKKQSGKIQELMKENRNLSLSQTRGAGDVSYNVSDPVDKDPKSSTSRAEIRKQRYAEQQTLISALEETDNMI